MLQGGPSLSNLTPHVEGRGEWGEFGGEAWSLEVPPSGPISFMYLRLRGKKLRMTYLFQKKKNLFPGE
jgi:hypothetical protein